jgi:hypothetical protein
MPYPSVEESHRRLLLAGWSVGETAVPSRGGWAWAVTLTRGGHRLMKRGASREEAWYLAAEESAALDTPPGA